jgi:hypothetical protein
MTSATTAEPTNWSPLEKIAFRFFALLFLLYIFFNPNGVLPFSDNLFGYYITPFHWFIPWAAKHILHLAKPITVFTNGSGDTTYDYITILLIAFLAAIGTVIWTLTGRNTKNYNKLFYWVTVVIRYYAGITMVAYGCFKVIKLQFPYPSLGRLQEPLGDMSPMGLAWTYLGYSTGFNYFAGLAELSCGLLLFFRKTTTLGAILLLVVAGNIMAINYCFDVPVKLLSTALVAMAIFLLARDSNRLVNFFFRNEAARPSNLSPHRFKARWKNITLSVIKYAMIIYTVGGTFFGAIQSMAQYGDQAPKPPLYGIYKVEKFVLNKDTLPPLTTDTTRWAKLTVSRAEGAQIKLMNDSTKFVAFKPDTVKHKIVAYLYTDTLHKFNLSYNVPVAGVLTLRGQWKTDSIYVKLQKLDQKKFRLVGRGFHWVNEYPLNK